MPQERLPPWNVLVFPAVTEIGLEIHSALRDSKEVILHGATLAGPNLATFHYKQLHTLPFISDPTCLAKLQQLIAQHKIDAIFPAHDDVVVWLAKHTNQLKATVITSPLESCLICRSKSKTYEALAKAITVPQFFKEDTITFPVFVKPDIGQGSQRARSIDNAADLRYALAS